MEVVQSEENNNEGKGEANKEVEDSQVRVVCVYGYVISSKVHVKSLTMFEDMCCTKYLCNLEIKYYRLYMYRV